MNRYVAAGFVLLMLVGDACAGPAPFALLYGSKHAFGISAPAGWVVDNTAGEADGLLCVLYLKGETWQTAEPLMYANIASVSEVDAEAFAKTAIENMKKERGEYAVKRVAAGKTKGGQSYFINEYSPTKKYPRSERVAYVQMRQGVAYIVFSCARPQTLRKHERALTDAVESLMVMDVKNQDGR